MNDGSICHMDPWAIRDWSYFSTVTLLGKDNALPNDMLHEKMECVALGTAVDAEPVASSALQF